MEKKTEILIIRLTPKQKKNLKSEANKRNMTMTDYVSTALNRGISLYEIKEIEKVINKLIANDQKIASNINQIARHINSFGSVSNDLFFAFQQNLSSYKKQINNRNKVITKVFNDLQSKNNSI